MRQFDLSPLYRATVGFDRLSRALDSAARLDDSAFAYPPYNIEKLAEDRYRITMAVAGFGQDDLEIVTHEGVLTVKGKAAQQEGEGTYLHRGIARRAFERKFQLADYIRVDGARLENGLLDITLVREVPEAMKPRTIAIERADAPAQVTEQTETRQAA
jgi:molecular chaperone IbpA